MTNDGSLDATSGDALLIPPGVWHRFLYDHEINETWSIKFKVKAMLSQTKMRIIHDNHPATIIAAMILNRLPDALNKHSAIILEYLLADLLDLTYGDNELCEPQVINDLNRLIQQNIKEKITIKNLAKKLRYSKDYLNRVVKRYYGCTLKAHIDNEKFELAKQYLNYSGRSVTEIADLIGFRDVFLFSRFFKRMNGGESPMAFLKCKSFQISKDQND
jgi:AraC family transcriptional activator of pobA